MIYKRKKSNTTKLKKFNELRIVNPFSDFYNVILNARQGFKIVLDPVDTLTNVSKDAKWKINLFSDFICFENKTIDKNNRENFHFIQKYDFDSKDTIFPLCDENGSVSLGNITIELDNNNHPESKHLHSRLLISIKDNEQISVMDPEEFFVKIYPNSILKIILTHENVKPITWNIIEKQINKDLILRKISSSSFCETWQPKFNQLLEGETLEKIRLNQKMVKFVNIFEYKLDENCLDKVTKGNSIISNFIFNGDGEKRSVNIILNTTKKQKCESAQKTMLTKSLTEFIDSFERLEEIVQNVPQLWNPGVIEVIDFNKLDNEIFICLARPSCLCKQIPSEERWIAFINSANSKISLSRQQDKQKWGHNFQVFHVKADIINNFGTISIGTVVFKAGEIRKEIQFWHIQNESRQIGFHQTTVPTVIDHTARINSKPYVNLKYSGQVAQAIDLKLEKIKKSLMEGLEIISIAPIIPPPLPITFDSFRKHERSERITHNVKTVSSFGCTTYLNPPDGHEILIPSSSKAVISMPFKVHENIISAWALRITDDRLIKVSDVKCVIHDDVMHLEVLIEPIFPTDRIYSAKGGTLLFTSGDQVRKINVRITSASNNYQTIPQILPEHYVTGITKKHYHVIKEFNHKDGVLITPESLLYVKLQTFPENYSVSIDLNQTPLPESITTTQNFDKIRDKINPNSPWFLSGFPAFVGKAVTIRNISINPVWEELKLLIKHLKQIHVADLVFRGELRDKEIEVDSAFGKIEKSTKITKILSIVLDLEDKSTGHATVFDPIDNSEILVTPKSTLSIVLKKTDSDYPWYEPNTSKPNGIQFIDMIKMNGNFRFNYKVTGEFTTEPSFIEFNCGADDKCISRKIKILFKEN